jgi:hypothetical protein
LIRPAAIGSRWSVSSDFVHTLGLFEPRFQNINPRIESVCNPAHPGSTPGSARCVRGVNSRYFDQAFVAAGLPANRLEQINMFTTTNARSSTAGAPRSRAAWAAAP